MLADRSIEWSNRSSQSYFNLAWQSLEISRPWIFPGPGNFQGVGRASPPGNFQAPQIWRWCPLEISRWANILIFIALRIWSESLQFEVRNIFRPTFTMFLQIKMDWSVKLTASLIKCTFACQNMTFAMWKTWKYLIDIWFKELNNQSTWFLLKHYKGVYKIFGLINYTYSSCIHKGHSMSHFSMYQTKSYLPAVAPNYQTPCSISYLTVHNSLVISFLSIAQK